MNEVGHLGSNPGNPANIQRLKIVKLLSIISAAAKLLLLGTALVSKMKLCLECARSKKYTNF